MTRKLTHKDIYTKFMIEYDKANVTSSYPSLTEYEVATLLDKAYLALIAQKVIGNNPRRAPFEADNKAIADIEPLIAHADPNLFDNEHTPAINVTQYNLPDDYMYFIQSQLNYNTEDPLDKLLSRLLPTKLVTHEIALKFFCTQYNMPWVKNPVCYIENNVVYNVYDPINKPNIKDSTAHLTYIKKPKSFVRNLIDAPDDNPNVSAFILDLSKLDSNDRIQ